MKKKYILPITVCLLSSSLFGCTNYNESLTFGTYITQSLSTLKELDNGSLMNKVNQGETFLLAVYQGEHSTDCLCWSTFQNVIVNYMNKYNEMIYIYDAHKQDETVEKLKIEKVNLSTPYLYIFSGDSKLSTFSYSKNQDKPIFSELDGNAMYTRVHQRVKGPSIYNVDDTFIKENIKNAAESNILFVRESCADCQYVLPNILIPYVNICNLRNKIWLFDLDYYYQLSKSDQASEQEKAQYQNIKDYYNLSEKSENAYGYLTGVVPTIQHYQSGVLKDACVFFNDVISENEYGSYYVSESFYSEERLTSLSYCENVETKVLKGMVLNDNDIAKTPSGYAYWAQEKAAVYHTPLFTAFLDTYCR